jgi:hypothetical protein
VLADDATCTVDEPRLGEARDVVVRERRAFTIADDRIREAVALDEPACVTAEVLGIDPHHDKPRRPVPLRDRLEQRCFLLARDTPGSPEVQDDDLSTQSAESQRPFAVQASEREVGSGRRPSGGKRRVERATAAVRDEPGTEQNEEQNDNRQRNRLQN